MEEEKRREGQKKNSHSLLLILEPTTLITEHHKLPHDRLHRLGQPIFLRRGMCISSSVCFVCSWGIIVCAWSSTVCACTGSTIGTGTVGEGSVAIYTDVVTIDTAPCTVIVVWGLHLHWASRLILRQLRFRSWLFLCGVLCEVLVVR